MWTNIRRSMVFSSVAAVALALATQVFAQSDLFVRDTASDSGAEPYSGPGPVYLSPDIWVRNEPDPNFDPYPFSTASPAWTPAPHQNPEYRDSKTSRPNYVYVRVHNRGSSASSGTERLRLYQAKASTGLSWPSAWNDNMANACGQSLLHGIEITKPRRNAKSVSATERQAYRDAVIAIQTDPAFRYSDGMPYFEKQNVVHNSGPEHGNPAFLPWHREMVNRFEERLREHDPLLTLLYWAFTEDPTAGTNLFTNNFMGTSNGTVGGPLGAALPTTVSRNVGAQSCIFDSDATLLGFGAYPGFANRVEDWPRNHDCAHGHIGGFGGNISAPSTAVQDPFFFQLHGNVDRHWATWQRDGADPARLDPVAVYGADSSNSRINADMRPWNGSFGVPPWTGAGAYAKTSKDRSVVFPPIYDTAPLNIPVLQPGESVVVEIPWYPPNVNNYNCAGQAGHFCLLARIETQTGPPFGMTVPETTSISANTVNNNNIAWKNLTIVDNVVEPSLMFLSGTVIQNVFDRETVFVVRLLDRTVKRRFLLQEFAHLAIVVPEEILRRISRDDRILSDLKIGEIKGIDRKVLLVTGKSPGFRLPMKPRERFVAEFAVRLRDEKPPRELLAEPFLFDIEQVLDLPKEHFGARESKALEVGGVRFELDIGRLARQRPQAERKLQVADLELKFDLDRFRAFRSIDRLALDNLHLSPGEPLMVTAGNDDPAKPMLRMMLEIDGKQMATTEEERLSEEIRFDRPGVHTITMRAVNADGELVQRRARVLVSENIPPVVAILAPEPGTKLKLGERITVLAETAPAYRREVAQVTLHAKDDRLFQGGMNLIESDYPVVARSEGSGPHELTFSPEKAGMYMLQVGARDSAGNLGVSGHLMVEVTE